MTIATQKITTRGRVQVYEVPAGRRFVGSIMAYAAASADISICIANAVETGFDAAALEAQKVDDSGNSVFLARQNITPPDDFNPSSSASAGSYIASNVDATIFVVGAPADDSSTTNAGRAYVFKRTNTGEYKLIQILTASSANSNYASNGLAMDDTASRIALVQLNATNTIQILYSSDPGNDPYSEEQMLSAPSVSYASGNDSVLSMDGAGERIAYGEYNFNSNTGKVKIYKRTGTVWALEQEIQKPVPASGDSFGHAIKLTQAGDRIVISARSSDPSLSNQGEIFVYSRAGTTWTHEASLTNTSAETNQYLGDDVDIDDTGTRIIASAVAHDSVASNGGIVVVFKRDGTTWTEEQEIFGQAASEGFGRKAAISGDGNIIAIGAPNSDEVDSSAGKVLLYSRVDGVWSLYQTILPTFASPNSALFGADVVIEKSAAEIPPDFSGTYASYNAPVPAYTLVAGARQLFDSADPKGGVTVLDTTDATGEAAKYNAVIEDEIVQTLAEQADSIIDSATISQGSTYERTALILDQGDNVVVVSNRVTDLNVRMLGFAEIV